MEQVQNEKRFYFLANMKFFPALFLLVLLVTGCASSFAFSSSDSSPTVLLSTPTSASRQTPFPSPTNIQLPYRTDTSDDGYCKPPSAVLPVEDGNDISEDEIVHELINLWLKRYVQPNTPPVCRIADYTIDRVYSDPGVYSQALEPRGDFMRIVSFSVELTQVPSDWMGLAGELDQDNWLHVTHVVAVTETDEGYKLDFAYP